MAVVYLSLGSNLGDRVGYIQQATSLLSANENIQIISTSSFYESEPSQMNSEKWFVNATVEISTTLSPENLLNECKRVETLLGRNPEEKGKKKDRTIDIDIIFYDNKVINTPELTIPHRDFHRRAFMMVPMLEVGLDVVHPIFGKTVMELYEALDNPEMVCLYGTRI